MPRISSLDLNTAIRRVVSDEVTSALAPYRELLNRLAVLAGVRRGPGRPPGPARTASRRGRKPALRARRARSGKKWAAGAKVRYKQGRGTFDAVVVSQNTETKAVLVEREKDGKKVVRDPGALRARG